MRSSLVLIALISFPALACPKLDGIYKICRTTSIESTTAVSQIMIEQNLVNGFTNFDISTKEAADTDFTVEKYIADGKVKVTTETDADSGVTIKTSSSASCSSTTMTIRLKAIIASEEFMNVVIKTTKTGNQLTQVYTGKSMGEDVNDTVICE